MGTSKKKKGEDGDEEVLKMLDAQLGEFLNHENNQRLKIRL